MAPTDMRSRAPLTTRLLARQRLLVLRSEKVIFALKSKRIRPYFLRSRVAPSLELAPLLPPSARTVIDVGANRGQFMLLAREVYPDAEIHAVEAQPQLKSLLDKLAVRDGRSQIYCVALADKASSATLHIAGRDDSSSLLEIGELQCHEFPGTEEVDRVTVDTMRLDDLLDDQLLPKPVLLKIDVQGFELAVLRGAKELLPSIAWVLMECSYVELYKDQPLAGDIVTWMCDHGYALHAVGEPWVNQSGEPVQADFVFRRNVPAS